MNKTLKNILNIFGAYQLDDEHKKYNIVWLEAQLGSILRHYKEDIILEIKKEYELKKRNK